MSKSLKSSNGSVTFDNSGIGNKSTISIITSLSYGSRLNVLLESLIENCDSDDLGSESLTAETDDKLEFNDVGFYRGDIEDFSSYLSIVEEKIETIDNELLGSKTKILRSILDLYKDERRSILIDNEIHHKDNDKILQTIKKNSDRIISNISKKIIDHAQKDLSNETIENMRDTCKMIVCYGFINCKILENPNDYN